MTKPQPAPSAELESGDEQGMRFRDAYVTVTRSELLVQSYIATARLPLDQLRTLLAGAGLAIVPAASVCSAEDKRVLEAMAMVPAECLLDSEADAEITPDWYLRMARAELARRAAKAKL